MAAHRLALPLNLTAEETYPYVGVRPDGLSPQVMQMITHFVGKVIRLAEPRGVWNTFSVDQAARGRISLLGTSLLIEGPTTAAHFASCDKITLFAVTIGPQVDAVLEELSREDPTRALILDGIASAAVEHGAEQLDALISGEIRHHGYFPTARFSPGYGDWPLSWQRSFLDAVEAGKINLTCTSHYLLRPVKSVTAALGWSRIPVERSYSLPERKKACQGPAACKSCPLTDCSDRIRPKDQ